MLFRKKNNKIILIGLNHISLTLARRLSKNHDVIIYYQQSRLPYGNINMDALIEKIDGSVLSLLQEKAVEQVNCIVALTDDDQYNLFLTSIAKDLGIARTVAMVQQIDYLELRTMADLIFNPHQLIIDQISNKIKETRLLNIRNFIPGQVDISELMVTNKGLFSYQKIKNIILDEGLIIALNRGNKMMLPSPELQLYPGDKVFILFRKNMMANFFKIFKRYQGKKRLFILGGTGLALTMLRVWENIFEPIIVVERSLEKCNQLAALLEKIIVLHGEGIDLQMLREEGLDHTSNFLAVDLDDYSNLLSGFGAEKIGCNNVITLLNNPNLKHIGSLLGLANILSLPDLLAEYIIKFISSGQGFNKYVLGDQIYTTEIKIAADSRLLDQKISEIKLPSGIKIGIIKRDNKIVIPRGDVIIKTNDLLFIFFYHEHEAEIYNIFNSRYKY